MTGTDRERRQRRLRWAAEQLGLAADACAEEVRTAWLRLLPEDEFVPPPPSRWALQALLGRGGESEKRANESAAQEEEERLRGEVETFAGQFWDLVPEERRRRWQVLMDRCTFPAISARLNLLMRGLDTIPMPSESIADSHVIELARHVRELFVLRPGPRARARQAFLRRMRNDVEAWRAAVRALRRAFPALAALGSDLLDKVQIASSEAEPLPSGPPPRPMVQNADGKSPRWPIWLVVLIAMTALRGFTSIYTGPSIPSTKLPALSPLEQHAPMQRENKMPPAIWDKHRPINKEELEQLLKDLEPDRKPKGVGEQGNEPHGRRP